MLTFGHFYKISRIFYIWTKTQRSKMLFLVDMLISKLSSLSWNVTEVSEMSTHHIEFELFLRLKLHCKHNKTLRIEMLKIFNRNIAGFFWHVLSHGSFHYTNYWLILFLRCRFKKMCGCSVKCHIWTSFMWRQ